MITRPGYKTHTSHTVFYIVRLWSQTLNYTRYYAATLPSSDVVGYVGSVWGKRLNYFINWIFNNAHRDFKINS